MSEGIGSERMAGEDLELFERSLRHATESAAGAEGAEALDLALDELGWHDALAEDRRTAVALLFELQGSAASMSSQPSSASAASASAALASASSTVLVRSARSAGSISPRFRG